MKNVQMTDIKIMKMYGTAGLFTLRTIVILKKIETQSQKIFCEFNRFRNKLISKKNRKASDRLDNCDLSSDKETVVV